MRTGAAIARHPHWRESSRHGGFSGAAPNARSHPVAPRAAGVRSRCDRVHQPRVFRNASESP